MSNLISINIIFLLGSILFTMLGGYIISSPTSSIAAFAIIVITFLVIAKIFNSVFYSSIVDFDKQKNLKAVFYTIEIIVAVLFAGFLLSNEKILDNITPFIVLLIGFWMALKGIYEIVTSVYMKIKTGYPTWYYSFWLGIVYTAVAALIITFAKMLAAYFGILVGVSVVIAGITGAVFSLMGIISLLKAGR